MIRIIKISFLTLPMSFVITGIIDAMMGSILGGISTVVGFPIPYYYDVFETPTIEYSLPIIKYLNVLLVYSALTYLIHVLKTKKL